MKKYFMAMGSIFISILLLTTVTAIPNSQSNVIINKINEISEINNTINNDKLSIFLSNVMSGGIIELLIQLITLLVQFILEIIEIVQNVIGLVNLIQNLISAFTTLFQLLQELIDLITNLFNPSAIIN
jgi:hypothetical protein